MNLISPALLGAMQSCTGLLDSSSDKACVDWLEGVFTPANTMLRAQECLAPPQGLLVVPHYHPHSVTQSWSGGTRAHHSYQPHSLITGQETLLSTLEPDIDLFFAKSSFLNLYDNGECLRTCVCACANVCSLMIESN